MGLTAVILVALGAAIVAAKFTGTSSSSVKSNLLSLGKGGNADPDSAASKAGIANEGPGGTLEAQEEALRAYPADSVPAAAVQSSIATFKALSKKAKGPDNWQSIGPSKAQYPAFLDQFLAGGKPYVASGRVTALALGGCKKNNKCILYLGAAGGGVWVTKKAFDGGDADWKYVSSSFGTNAIGSLLVDPSDPTGDTAYAGTGEPNASGDSEAGLGIYKTTDGGDSWTLVPGSIIFRDRAVSSLAFDKDGNLLVGLASAIRGISSVSGGAVGCFTPTSPPGCSTRGVWRQSGATFTLLRPTGIRGTTEVAVDPNNPMVLYQSSFAEGIWRSVNNGASWTQIKPALNPANSADRATFALAKLPGGFTRMYVGDGNTSDAGANRARFYRTNDAAGAAVFTDMTTPQNIGYCTAQCWYDNVVVSAVDSPDVVYLGGSYSYDQVHAQSNGRAVILSTDGGVTWSDMTLDKNHDGWLHPDQHALVTNPSDPLQAIIGDDGGVVRTNGKFQDASGECADRSANPADNAYCQSLLWRVPDQTTVMNKGLVTLQFQSFSFDPKHPQNSLMGGTQDNGTFEYKGSSDEWPQIIYGDGGQSGWNAADSKLRFNTFFGQANDVNFRDGAEKYWVVATGPIAASPEGSAFYPPVIADPTAAFAGSIFQGSQSVWRSQDWGGDQSYLEANCSEFTTAFNDPACGDFVRIGSPSDLTSIAYGADRRGDLTCPAGAGGCMAAIERAPSNTGTMWAATATGRVFITDNANATPASSVVWQRLDNSATNDPNRFVSSIYVDPANPNHAWISYSGYNINTPSTPGHVFEVTRTGPATATWVDRTYDLQDLPVTDLVRDDLTGDLYASTDFAVWQLPSGATSWVMAGGGMPMVEVPGLTIVPSERVLYAATHGLGGWKLKLSKVK
jgi:hypothetical protein